MKKQICCLFVLVFILSMVGCTKTTAEHTTTSLHTDSSVSTTHPIESPDKTTADKSQTLVVYFSRTGNTRSLAEYAAQYYGADIYEILAKRPYSDADIQYNNPDSRATKEQKNTTVRPEINGAVANMAQYSTIILAYPIWWGQAPRIINTFLESYDFSGKTILPFCTSASSDIGSSDDDLHPLVSDSVHWMDGKRFAAGTSAEELTGWLEEVLPANGNPLNAQSKEATQLKLQINDTEIPVTWETSPAVEELCSEASSGSIRVPMSMYGGWEQVGSLGHSYTTDDAQITAVNGDIVLYGGNQIVLFYGSNSWSYTKLGKMNLPPEKITELLSNGDITLTLSSE